MRALGSACLLWLAWRIARSGITTWQDKTIIDTTNVFGVPIEDLQGQPSSAVVAKAFTGARVVKGFNHLPAAVLAADPNVNGGNRVVFLSSDDDNAVAPVAALAEYHGFAPIALGPLKDGGSLVQARGNAWAQLIFKDLVKFKWRRVTTKSRRPRASLNACW
ncbi:MULTISPECIES: NADPH-dependent F420 reductase [unclassified Paraburkholderia]|uniref:NADPH-dependent F420 reductase n=1 Tax=unclassified Paraburkholderia TaxID=2615204 RepID=UPI0021A33B44|nr:MULTISPECIES: hypothetical protein [unclassified Paraburkholderia]